MSNPAAAHWAEPSMISFEQVAADYVVAGASEAARKSRRGGVAAFRSRFGDLSGWAGASVRQRRAVRTEVASFAAHAVVRSRIRVDVEFVTVSGCRWGHYLAAAYPDQHDQFRSQAAALGSAAERSTGCGRTWPGSP